MLVWGGAQEFWFFFVSFGWAGLGIANRSFVLLSLGLESGVLLYTWGSESGVLLYNMGFGIWSFVFCVKHGVCSFAFL
jgi:hypothetical protein